MDGSCLISFMHSLDSEFFNAFLSHLQCLPEFFTQIPNPSAACPRGVEMVQPLPFSLKPQSARMFQRRVPGRLPLIENEPEFPSHIFGRCALCQVVRGLQELLLKCSGPMLSGSEFYFSRRVGGAAQKAAQPHATLQI